MTRSKKSRAEAAKQGVERGLTLWTAAIISILLQALPISADAQISGWYCFGREGYAGVVYTDPLGSVSNEEAAAICDATSVANGKPVSSFERMTPTNDDINAAMSRNASVFTFRKVPIVRPASSRPPVQVPVGRSAVLAQGAQQALPGTALAPPGLRNHPELYATQCLHIDKLNNAHVLRNACPYKVSVQYCYSNPSAFVKCGRNPSDDTVGVKGYVLVPAGMPEGSTETRLIHYMTCKGSLSTVTPKITRWTEPSLGQCLQ